MGGVFSAFPAILGKVQLFCGVDLVFFRNIVLRFTNRTNERNV